LRKIRVVLPAYNEEESLPQLLKRLEKTFQEFNLNMEILVVNDGSTDNTLSIAKNFNGSVSVKVFDQQPNKGLAEAMRNGLSEGIKDLEGNDILVTMDADDSQNPFLINRMVHQIREGSDLVIASRYQHGAKIVGLTVWRRFLSWGAGLMFRVVVRLGGVKDYTCGFRAYKVVLLKKAMDYYGKRFIEQKGFGCMAEILLKLKRFHPIINEVPMILRYDQKIGESKMKVNRTIKQTFLLLFKFLKTSGFNKGY